MTSFVRWFALIPLLTLASVPACSGDSTDDTNPSAPANETGDGDEVTDVTNSKVKDQSIGNCWVYATSAWAESLRLSYSGQELNLSESYLSYIDWFHGIQAGEFDLSKDGLQTGGWFGEAVEYMRRYGLMDEATFIPEEANAQESSRQKTALAAINASLKSGVLSDPANRRDKNKVRDELDKAFQLSPTVIALLDQSFGHDLSRTIANKGATIPKGKGLRAATELEVGYYKPKTGSPKVITLADAIGLPSSDSTYGWKARTGQFSWNETIYPSTASSQRTFQIKAQKALNNRQPTIMVWFVDFNAMDRTTGTFKAPPTAAGHQGGHMTVLEDYQVSNVPGFGTLAAGVNAKPDALAASLDPKATIDFFRIKNSWGTGFQPPAGTDLAGYHDLYMPYLNGQIPVCNSKDAQGKCINPTSQRGLTAMVLPSDAWGDVSFAPPSTNPAPTSTGTTPPPPASTCAHDLCSTGAKLTSSCDPCAATVCAQDDYCCNNSWDGTCVQEVAQLCKKTCGK